MEDARPTALMAAVSNSVFVLMFVLCCSVCVVVIANRQKAVNTFLNVFLNDTRAGSPEPCFSLVSANITITYPQANPLRPAYWTFTVYHIFRRVHAELKGIGVREEG